MVAHTVRRYMVKNAKRAAREKSIPSQPVSLSLCYSVVVWVSISVIAAAADAAAACAFRSLRR